MKINTVRPQDNEFTHQLSAIAKPPLILYYRGTLPKKAIKSVAIVGSRRPTPYGKIITEKLVQELAKYGVIIVSGLALGIDSVAHRSALKHNTPTIAVMGRGLSKTYPASHHSLAENIIKAGGALISTYQPDTPAYPSNFLERNRIVSGLAKIVIVTEAAARSGTLNTSTHAIEQGKDVFAVPGNITSPMSAGCNRLIRQGAQPLIDVSDVISTLGIQKPSAQPAGAPKRTNKLEQTILDLLIELPSHTNTLTNHINTDPSRIFSALSTLEIEGIIRSDDKGDWHIM